MLREAGERTYPCCVLSEVAAFVLYTVGVPDPLQELHLFYYVLPFLSKTSMIQQTQDVHVCICIGDAL